MTCRWLLFSGFSPGADDSGRLVRRAALELSQRHRVLLWDAAGSSAPQTPPAKSWSQLLPYRKAFSPDLLRNFLRAESGSLCLLSGAFSQGLPDEGPLLQLIQNSFDFVMVSAPPVWDGVYLAFLDRAHQVFFTVPPGMDPAAAVRPHLEQLSKYKFPKALARVIPASDQPEDVRSLVRRLETFTDTSDAASPTAADTREIKNRIHERLLETSPADVCGSPDKTRTLLENLLSEETGLPPSRETRERVFSDLLHQVTGLGPLEPLLNDPSVTEIMVNGPEALFVEKQGRLHPAGVRFESETQLRAVIDRIVAPIARRVDESAPLCDARLPDGSRVHIVLPPLALEGPTVTIRKFSETPFNLESLVQRGALSAEMGEFLGRCVRGRKNIVVSGGTGSGKTTLLNVLSGLIAGDERIVTIEDAAELRLRQPHVVRLESRPANAEGRGAVSIRTLVINALRMRPDRIVVGECRGGEALDMLQAMNTGHDGSLTTLHANSPRDALGRLETLVLMAGIDLPVRVVREQIRSAVHLLVQVARFPDGARRIVSLTELTGMEGDVLTTAEVFRFHAGRFESTGLVPQGVR
jgi:pilus assembly protein CpaF